MYIYQSQPATQIYWSTMEVIEAFQLNEATHDVRIFLDNDDNPWFNANDIGNILELKNIRVSIKNYDADYKCVYQLQTAGGEQQVSYVSEIGLYKLVMSSKKPAALLFQKWVFNVIKQIRKNGRYELVQEHDTQQRVLQALIDENTKLKMNEDHVLHNTLLDMYSGKTVVYFGIVGSVDGKIILKIGYTDDIRTRNDCHLKDFGSFILIKVMEIFAHSHFEKWLHQHDYLANLKYKMPVKVNGGKSHEVYLVDEVEKQKIFNIASRKVYIFRQYDAVQQNIQLIKLFYDLNKLKDDQKMTEKLDVIDSYLDKVKVDPSELNPVLLFANTRKFTQARGDKIQAYYPDGTLYKTYISIKSAKIDVVGSNTQLKNAINECNIYKTYRWLKLDRSLPDDTIQTLPPTRDITRRSVTSVMIAILNSKKTAVTKVFANQRMIMKEYDIKCAGTVSSAIKRGGRFSYTGGYLKKWDDISQEMKNEYLNNNVLPKPFIRSNAKPVNCYNIITDELIETFPNVQAVLDKFGMGRNSLYDAIENNILTPKGYRWRYANDVHN